MNGTTNGTANGSAYSPKFNLYDMIKYNGRKYMVVEVDYNNERYGLTDYAPMYVNSHAVDQSAMKMGGTRNGPKSKYTDKRKRDTRKTRRRKRKYYF